VHTLDAHHRIGVFVLGLGTEFLENAHRTGATPVPWTGRTPPSKDQRHGRVSRALTLQDAERWLTRQLHRELKEGDYRSIGFKGSKVQWFKGFKGSKGSRVQRVQRVQGFKGFKGSKGSRVQRVQRFEVHGGSRRIRTFEPCSEPLNH
jgi:hypothetical protein